MENEGYVTITVREYNALTRNDERLRILLDMYSEFGLITTKDLIAVCGIFNHDDEEEK